MTTRQALNTTARKIGDNVRIVPTQGSYQKSMVGLIVGETRTEWRVTAGGSRHVFRFRKSNGSPVEKWDQRFPCYFMEL